MSKRIYINPGHGYDDPGAVGYEVERNLNVKVSEYQRAYLAENYDCEIRVYTGSVIDVAADANAWGADLFVSNHFNAGRGDGYEALVYSPNREDLGRIFEKHVMAIGQNSRGVKYRPDLVVLNSTNAPAILNEGAFVDNWNDIEDWNDDSELKRLGEAYAKATAEYENLPKKEVKPVVPAYTEEQFIRDVQAACGAVVDGIAGPETIGKTVTLSAYVNCCHAVVKPVQKRLDALGYKQVGIIDGIAGPKFTQAVKAFQMDNGCISDGEVTAGCDTWKKLLGMI